MAARTATKSRRTTKKAAPLEEDLDEDIEEDEVEEDEDEEPAPKSRSRKAAPAKKTAKAAPKGNAKVDADTLGTSWLKEHVNDVLGTDHESTKLRIVLRKLIKDGDIDSPKDGRYVFTGPKDPNVKAVIAALRDEAKSGPAKRGRKPKTKVVDEVDDEEVEDLDLDDE
jgi:hypothetical protein